MPVSLWMACDGRSKLLSLLLLSAAATSFAPQAVAEDFSEWNQTTGIKTIEYRWKNNGDAHRCELEYRNLDTRDHRKYKSRIVYQLDGDEHVRSYNVVSFAQPEPPSETIPSCTQVTDVSVTRF